MKNMVKENKIDITNTKEEKIMKVNLNEYIEEGRYGYTRTQMLPAINKALGEDDDKCLAVLKALYEKFPDVFTATVRYVPARGRMFIIENFELHNNFDVVTPGAYGVTRTQTLEALTTNCENTDFVKAVFEKFPTMANGCVRYMNPYVYGMVQKARKSEWTYANEFKSMNNKKLAELIKNNVKVATSLNETEQKYAKEACKDVATKDIAEKYNTTKDKVYNVLFRNNGKSVLTRTY